MENLPKTATVEMYAHVNKFGGGVVALYPFDMSGSGYILLGPVSVTFDVPQIDIVAAEISSLEKVKATVVQEYESKLNHINEQLKNLRALTYSHEDTVDL